MCLQANITMRTVEAIVGWVRKVGAVGYFKDYGLLASTRGFRGGRGTPFALAAEQTEALSRTNSLCDIVPLEVRSRNHPLRMWGWFPRWDPLYRLGINRQ